VEEGNRTKDLLSAFQFVPGDTGVPSVPRLRPSFETPEDSSGKPALPALSAIPAVAAVSRLLHSKF
jgi:hypothetical protein